MPELTRATLRSPLKLWRPSSIARSEYSPSEEAQVRVVCRARRGRRESAGTHFRIEGRIVKVLLCAALATMLIGSPTSGQVAPTDRRYEVRGTVFDSIVGVPLAGAVVQVAARSSERAPHTVVTDSLGRFAVPNLPSGAFVVGFYHDNLTALGLDAPLTAVELGADSVVIVDLWIPSAPVVRALRCGRDTTADAGGMLVGSLRDAEDGSAVHGAVLRLSWRALALDSANYRTVTERAAAEISADGSYLVCHLPVDAMLELEVNAPGHRTLTGAAVLIPVNGLARLDVALADTKRTQGTSRIRGQVTRLSGKVVTSGRAIIAALGREVSIRDGVFQMNDVPSGSWVIEVHVIGSEPNAALVNAREGTISLAEMRVGESLQRLEAVTVVGKRDAHTRLLEDVLRRKRIGMGTVFLPGSPALKSATFTSDVMKEARGFRYGGQASIVGRMGCRSIAVFVDDVLQPDGFAGLDAVAAPSDVLAVETFPDILFAPVQYRIMKTVLGTFNDKYCAVVLVWTKNRSNG